MIDGKNYSRHLFEYRYANAHWGMEIVAASPTEAAERLKALAWAQYKGEVVAKVPVPGAGLIQRISQTLRGFYRVLIPSTNQR